MTAEAKLYGKKERNYRQEAQHAADRDTHTQRERERERERIYSIAVSYGSIC